MAIRFFDGFDYCGSAAVTSTQLTGKWTAVSGINPNIGRFGGKSGSGNSTVSASSCRYDIAAVPTGIMGVASIAGSPGNAVFPWPIMEFTDGTSVQCGLGIDSGGRVFLYRGTTATVIATGTTVLATNVWHYFEFKATIHNTSGAYEVRLDGASAPELIGTGANTRSTANNQLTGFQLAFKNSNAQYMDDFYAADTSGAVNNNFLGEIRVHTLFANAAGSSTQWTPLSSTNVSNIDDGGMDGDTTYNSSATANQIDLFGAQDITGATPLILAAAVNVDLRKDDAGVRNVRTKLKSGATVADGASIAVGNSYQTFRTQHDTDPATGTAWTLAAINGCEIGYENL